VMNRVILSITRSQAADVDIAIVCIPDKAVPTPLKFLIQFVQHKVR
jgi:hypothetical protein